MRIRFGLVILAIVGMAFIAPIPALAEGSTDLPLLEPAGELDAVRCRMLVAQSNLECSNSGCHWTMEQRWAIENTDKSQDRALTISLPGASELTSPRLLDEQGNTLTPQQSGDTLNWSLVMRAGKRASLTLSYETIKETGHFVHWAISGDALSRWGGIDGALVTVTVPDPIREDALVAIAPSHYALVGQDLSWEYENTATYQEHSMVMVAPPTISLLAGHQAAKDYIAVADLLQQIADGATSAGIAWPDPQPEIEAALQMAIDANPGDTTPLGLLANYYLDRRVSQPDLKHNYLVLAADALAKAVAVDPSDQKTRQRLAELYLEASQESSQSGDLEGAIRYMQLAESLGTAVSRTSEDQQLLALRLAVTLAKQGQPSEALASVGSTLTPATIEDIAHYAPPFAAAETRIAYGQHETVAETRLQLYAPLVDQSLQHIEKLIAAVSALEDVTAQVDAEGNACTVRVTQDSSTHQQEQTTRDAIVQALHDDADMLACLLSLPWAGEAPSYAVDETPWTLKLSFASMMDSTPLAMLYADQADYAGWRLAEIRARQPETSVAQLEQELVLAALGEQVTIWRQLPASSYWVVEVDTGTFEPGRAPRWVVGWHQSRPLDLCATEYRWGAIGATAGALSALCAFLALAALWGRNPR